MNDNKLVNKTFLSVLLVNITGLIMAIACVMIDAIITGQFLGKDAVTATGLFQPVTLICNLLGALFGPGLTIICTRYIGMAKLEKVKQVFSIVMIAIIVSSGLLNVLLFFCSPGIANVLGAKSGNDVVITMISDYLRGFSFSIIPLSMTAALSGLMMLDNDKNRGLAAVMIALVSDVIFDMLNVTVFHGGLWGMAMATTLSQTVGLIVVLTHFTKKDRVLRFTTKNLSLADLKPVMLCGIPNSVNMGSTAFRGICLNAVLLSMASEVDVAALSATNSFFNIINALALAVFVATSSLTSLFYGEEDKSSIVKTLKVSMKWALTILGIIAVLLMLFARGISRMFLDASAVAELNQAEVFMRLMALYYLFSAVSYSLCGAYQGTGKNILNSFLIAFREGGAPVLMCAILGILFGLHGFEAGLVLSGVIVLICCFIIPAISNKRFSVNSEDLLLLSKSFGPAPEKIYEKTIHSPMEVTKVSSEVMNYCLNSGASKRLAYLTSLCVEENALNTLTYGYKGDTKGYIDLRIICREDHIVLRFRDDGKPFDPLDWFEINNPEDESSGLGIRMILGLAQDVIYIPAMGLNNLMIIV